MPIEILIPRLGWSMEEGNFVGWLKKHGEPVKTGDLLFTLENEKATEDVEATDSGILRIPKEGPKPGEVVKVGQVIGHLLMEHEKLEELAIPSQAARSTKRTGYQVDVADMGKASSSRPSSIEQEWEKTAAKGSLSSGDGHSQPITRIPISPRARRLAAELGMDTDHLRGSGRTGRISERDVRAAASRISASGLSVMRRTIAQRTSQSFSSVPHFYLRSEVDVSALIQLRNDLLPQVERESGVRLTLTDLLLRAQGTALKNFPPANAIWTNDNIAKLDTCDVGLVVGLSDGMRIPIVRSPEVGTLATLAQQRSSLVELARSGKLSSGAMQGGATSLSNLGNTCVDEFAAVIMPGQSSMLAAGRASPRPYVVDGNLAVRATIRLCLSVDHRVLDGRPAAEFLGRIIELLESPERLV